MFRIDRDENSIKPLERRSFTELGFKETKHLQEWITKHPSCLGEDLLVIQKEFSGFPDTRERLDMLALDKEGRIVIIENKLDDTGRDVTWQALKYASYCASMKTENICKIYDEYLSRTGQPGEARELIADFLEIDDLSEKTLNQGISQRIILIAANFRKEVTSTVLWLMNFKLQVQCIKITPWSMGEDVFLNVEQIIPVKDVQDFVIGLTDKAQDEVQTNSRKAAQDAVRQEFWSNVIHAMNTKTESRLYNNISAGVREYITAGSGMRGVGFKFAMSKSYGSAEIYIDRGDYAENKRVFDHLYDQREELETAFGGELVWERVNDHRYSRIKVEDLAEMYNRENWPRIIEFMADAMQKLERAFSGPIQKLDADLTKFHPSNQTVQG